MDRESTSFVLVTLILGSVGISTAVCTAATSIAEALNGKWQWAATCDRGGFHGVMEFNAQSGSTFTGKFLETNFWDKG
jgi:hypothetical protein